MNCKRCRHWGSRPEQEGNLYSITKPQDPDTYKDAKMPFEVKECCHPSLVRFERPVESNGFALTDGSEYYAALATAEDFGCVRFEDAAPSGGLSSK